MYELMDSGCLKLVVPSTSFLYSPGSADTAVEATISRKEASYHMAPFRDPRGEHHQSDLSSGL